MKTHAVLLALILVAQAGLASATNYNSGISVSFTGLEGTDFAEEYYYFDKTFDDHRVIYLKDTTKITLFHNQFNTIQSRKTCQGTTRAVGTTGPDGIENNGDEGKILFRIDRDEQGHAYLGADTINLAYTQPFSLSQLEYEPGEPVMGNIGSNGGSYGSTYHRTTERYQKGILDEFGDEWHILKFWDDDTGISCEHSRYYTSDSKILYLVVNPKTPLIKFETASGEAQFYTTPPKAYHVPVLREQTTYITGNVNITLVNIMGGSIYYSIDGQAFQNYTGPISSNTLSNGEHTIEYYYNASNKKTRRLVKNPGYPSQGEGHGNILWEDEAELEYLKSKLEKDPYAWMWHYTKQNVKSQLETDYGRFPLEERLEERGWTYEAPKAFDYSIMPILDESMTEAEKERYFETAKKMLLQLFVADPLGAEMTRSWSLPANDRLALPNSGTNRYYTIPLGYDLLISEFKKTDGYETGITPIEDLKIRDNLASEAFSLMQERNVVTGPDPDYRFEGYIASDAHWGLGFEMLIYSFGLGMPSYDSDYYGTSGFDGTAATHAWTPYPDQPLTWKETVLTQTENMGHPNNRYSRRCDRIYESLVDYSNYPTTAQKYDLPLDGVYWTGPNAFVCCPTAYEYGSVDPNTLNAYDCIVNAEALDCEQYGLTTLYPVNGKVCQKPGSYNWMRSYNLPDCDKENSAVFDMELSGYEGPFVENLILTTIIHKKNFGENYCDNANEYLQTKMRRMLGDYEEEYLKREGSYGHCLINGSTEAFVEDNSKLLICEMPLVLYNPLMENSGNLLKDLNEVSTTYSEWYFWSKKLQPDILTFIFFENDETRYDIDHCYNGIQDGDETGEDCGGSCPNPCPECIDTATLMGHITQWKAGNLNMVDLMGYISQWKGGEGC